MAYQTDYGPYYRSSRRAMEGQRRALGYPSLSPEQIAGERYGEVSAYAQDERQRRQFEEQMALQRARVGQGQEALRLQKKEQEWGQAGQIVGGIATGVNVLDKLGGFGQGGFLKKAYTGLGNMVFPRTSTGVWENRSTYPSDFTGSMYQQPSRGWENQSGYPYDFTNSVYDQSNIGFGWNWGGDLTSVGDYSNFSDFMSWL